MQDLRCAAADSVLLNMSLSLGVWFSMFRKHSLPSPAMTEEPTKNSSKLA